MVNGIVGLIDCIIIIVVGGVVADSILDAADFVFDLIKAEDVIGEEVVCAAGLIFNAADFVFNFIETEDPVVKGFVDIKEFTFDCLQTKATVGDDIFNEAHFVLDLIQTKDAVC